MNRSRTFSLAAACRAVAATAPARRSCSAGGSHYASSDLPERPPARHLTNLPRPTNSSARHFPSSRWALFCAKIPLQPLYFQRPIADTGRLNTRNSICFSQMRTARALFSRKLCIHMHLQTGCRGCIPPFFIEGVQELERQTTCNQRVTTMPAPRLPIWEG